MTNVEIIKKIIGEVRPIGDSAVDAVRFESLKAMCDLVSALIVEINEVSEMGTERHEYSIKKAGEYANNFLIQTLT